MNNDVVIQILLHLPIRSLFRFRSVCKFWCDVILSPRFQKLHNELHNERRNDGNDKDDALYLRFAFLGNTQKLKLSIKLLDNGKSLKSHGMLAFEPKCIKVAGAVKGLICISSSLAKLPISICNPFLGQFKILPISPSSSSHSYQWDHHDVGVGFDEDYKVVQLLSCSEHYCLHASLYSRMANSWKELALDQELDMVKPIKSLCKKGSFAHWEGWGRSWDEMTILSFDMKNEVFRTITLSGEVFEYLLCSDRHQIFAKDECSFLLVVSSFKWIKVFESRGEGSELKWNHAAQAWYGIMPIWRSDDYVVLKNCGCVLLKNFFTENEAVLYDHRARNFIGRMELPADSHILDYEGSFISP